MVMSSAESKNLNLFNSSGFTDFSLMYVSQAPTYVLIQKLSVSGFKRQLKL